MKQNRKYSNKMAEETEILRSAIKFLCSDLEAICRLCLCPITSKAVYIYDTMPELTCSPYIEQPVPIIDMFTELSVPIESTLPQVICHSCATITFNAYLFQKLCQHSSKRWSEALEKIDQGLQQTHHVNPSSKSLFLLMNKDNTHMFETKTMTSLNSSTDALMKIKSLVKSRTYYKQNKKQQAQEYFTPLSVNNNGKPRFACSKCGKEFKSLIAVNGHYDRLHRPRNIQCKDCNKMFSTRALLSSHIHFCHIPAVCNQCNMRFPSKSSLKVHQDTHDEHRCSVCNKKYLNKTSYKMHFKYCGQTDSNSFFCDICGKGYARKNGIRTHLKVDHNFGQVLSCKWCDKKFDAPSRLKIHEIKHTKERNFSCEVCGGAFVSHAALVYHTRLHTGERPFPCDLCGQRFLSASRRMEHRYRKHFQPSKECDCCGMKFFMTSQLKKHMQRHRNPQSRLFVPVGN